MKLKKIMTRAMVLFSLANLSANGTELNQNLRTEVDQIADKTLLKKIDKLGIGLDDAQRKLSRGLLHMILSSEFVLYSKTLNYHWNVVGDRFGELHAFFQKLYEEQFKTIDLLAERLRALGWEVNATLDAYQKRSKITDEAEKNISADQMLKNLLHDYQKSIKSYRTAIAYIEEAGDFGTSNFLAELLVQHEKKAWMIRSYLTNNK